MKTLCACGCGAYPSRRGAEYIRGHRPPPTVEQLAERILAHIEVDTDTGCWNWKRTLTPGGYGQIGWGKQLVATHRIVATVHIGPIPEGLYVCHRCDNRRCCNPAHLFYGTALDNARDCIAKGRAVHPIGEAAARKLTSAQVAEIRRRHRVVHPARKTGCSSKELAAEFGVTKQYIGQLVARQWRTAG